MSALKPLPVVPMPQIIIVEDPNSALPLEHTQVSVQISGPLAVVAVTQQFGNPLNAAVELEYLYPLPEDAAVTAFTLRIGERTIEGSLQSLEAARTAYETARESGRRAGLLEQRRPNLFAVRIANVLPGETIRAEIHYQQRLRFEDDAFGGAYEFVYPMGITPKYDSPDHPDEVQGVHAPLARGEKIGPVEINLSADTGFSIREITSPSHRVAVTRVDERRAHVRLAAETIPDRDFVLRFARSEQVPSAAAWTSAPSSETGSALFMATLIPPVLESDPRPMPREYIFVLDRSGSMSGAPIRQARNALRACLRTLNAEDSFAILLFDNRLEWIQQEAVPVTQENIDSADAALERVEGRGGTEIIRALDAALALGNDPRRPRVIIFLTDGAVSAEARLLDTLRKNIGPVRLFTFGIGPSVNRALLSRMAALGRGRVQFLQLDEDIEGAIIRFQDSIAFPALTDLRLEWQNADGAQVYPQQLPDLYHGQPLEICGRFTTQAGSQARLILRGTRKDQPVELAVDLPVPLVKDPAVERIWAKARVDDLLERMALEQEKTDTLRDQITALAVEHKLVTPLTAFVALDTSEALTDGKVRLIRVAQPLPAGLEPGGFASPGPVMAASMLARNMPAAAQHVPAPDSAHENNLFGQVAFLRHTSREAGAQQLYSSHRPMPDQPQAPAGVSPVDDRNALLRWLARSQNLDGSWSSDVERTAAALLAFIRAGHTPHKGSYRQAVRRAARWLAAHPGQDWAAFARAYTLEALAQATGDPLDQDLAAAARQVLPKAEGLLQMAAAGGGGSSITVPDPLSTLDDLRLAAIAGVHRRVLNALLDGTQDDLVLTWAACLPDIGNRV